MWKIPAVLFLGATILAACSNNKTATSTGVKVKAKQEEVKQVERKPKLGSIKPVKKSTDKAGYIPFKSEVTFKCSGMTLSLHDFTIDMDDVPQSAGKATMFYITDIEMGGPSPTEKDKTRPQFFGQIWPSITFGRGKLRRKLPQTPKYLEHRGNYLLQNPPISYKGGVQFFDSVINAKDKTLDAYFDINCKSNRAAPQQFKYKTVIKIHKWPKRTR